MTDLRVERCDPRDREDGIKALFARNDRPQFEGVFERTYRPRSEQGLKSWVGLQDGRVVMHISVSPQRFAGGGDDRWGGFLGDLMVDAPLRDFWNSARLVRSMVKDVLDEGGIAFLVTATTQEAEAVFKAAGFKPLGVLQRYVLPLNPLYLSLRRLVRRSQRVRLDRLRVGEGVLATIGTMGAPGMWRPVPSEMDYETRIQTVEHNSAQWLHGAAAGGRTFVLITRHRDRKECSVADCFWDADLELPDVLLAAGAFVRADGVPKLVCSAPAESGLAQALVQAGFFPRAARSRLMLKVLEGPPLPSLNQWFLSHFSLSNW